MKIEEIELNMLQPSQTFLSEDKLIESRKKMHQLVRVMPINQILSKMSEDSNFRKTYHRDITEEFDFGTVIESFTKISGKYLIRDGHHRICFAYLNNRDPIVCKIVDLEADTSTFMNAYIAMKRGVHHVRDMKIVPGELYIHALFYDIQDVPVPKELVIRNL